MKDNNYIVLSFTVYYADSRLRESSPFMASKANRERTREYCEERRKGKLSLLSPPLTLAFPFACCSRVTSSDSSKWRACSQAMLTVQDGSTCNFCIL